MRVLGRSPKVLKEECYIHFNSIKDLYPLELMARKTLICIGTGGARSYIENMARSGVGKFILMDGDTVSQTNIATQSVYYNELRRYKTDVIKEKILKINPCARVNSENKFLDDSIIDGDFERITKDALASPTDVLIAGCTDSFHANARATRLALKYGTPYLQAGLYKNGVAAEISFSFPGVTPACARCCTSSRYAAYRDGFVNDATSAGSPIFASEAVNSIKGFISLILLLYKSGNNRYSGYLDMIKTRNFVQIKLDPFASAAGIETFDKYLPGNRNLFLGETLWIEQFPDNPENGCAPCPDCGGTGNLKDVIGKINDTRCIVE